MPTGSLKYKILAVCHDGTAEIDAAIKESPGWLKQFKSVWLVATKETPKALCDRLRANAPKNDDSILIMEVGSYYGYMPQEAWDWIKEVRAES